MQATVTSLESQNTFFPSVVFSAHELQSDLRECPAILFSYAVISSYIIYPTQTDTEIIKMEVVTRGGK
jgi:hypothetical protein